ncbi:MAG: hypothetical protein ACLQM8_15955 [Limisphaerales bacterium]
MINGESIRLDLSQGAPALQTENLADRAKLALQNLPLDTLVPLWHHAATMSASERQSSLSRGLTDEAARQEPNACQQAAFLLHKPED